MEAVPNEQIKGAESISLLHRQAWALQDMFVAFGFLSLVGTIASLLPAVFSGDRASVSMINHPGRNSHFHPESSLSETPSR